MNLAGNSGALKPSRVIVFRLLRHLRPVFTLHQRMLILHSISPAQRQPFVDLLTGLRRQKQLQLTLTFDDGFRSAREVLEKLPGCRAIFFVSPNYLSIADDEARERFFYRNLLDRPNAQLKGSLSPSMEPLSWADLADLCRRGHTIGAHTLNHVRLSRLDSVRALEKEIIGSGDLLEDRLNTPIQWFAYPFGNLGSIHKKAYHIIEKRYQHMCTGLRGNNYLRLNSHVWWRDAIDPQWPREYVEFILRGGIDWFYWYKRRRLLRMSRSMI